MKSMSWRQSSLIAVALLLGASLAHARGNELLVFDVQAAQHPRTALVDVWYRLRTVGDAPVTVSLFLSTDGGLSYSHLCRSVSGDVGAGVLPGDNRHIDWDAGADVGSFNSNSCRLRVTADDSPYIGDFAYIPRGSFTMGTPLDEPGRWGGARETQHQVTLTRGYYLSRYEVTEALWGDVMGGGSTSQLPKDDVNWYTVVEFCNALSTREGLTPAYEGSGENWAWNQGANGYRLPTEAEWEYACRAGSTTAFANGPLTNLECDDPNLDEMGWYCGNSGIVPHEVGGKQANSWGLYDMHGNVWEWCWDLFGDYPTGPVVDPVGPPSGLSRTFRGGCMENVAQECRSGNRNAVLATAASPGLGFRLARSIDFEATPYGWIVIDPEPNAINAPWQLSGPSGFSQSGNGDLTLTDMTAGDYTLTWGLLVGLARPLPAVVTQSLTANGTLTFTGVYTEGLEGFMSIPPGTFIMGSPTTEPERNTDETQHQVTLTHGIYVQTTEVTNQQYRDMAQWAYNNGHVTATTSGLYDNLDGSARFLKTLGPGYEISFNAGVFSCINPTHPAKYVTWYGSVAYCDWLSRQQGLPRAYSHLTWQCNWGLPYEATGYRLPTEAEWEYACRAGTQTPFNTGSCLDAGTEANYYGPYPYPGCPTGPNVGWTVPVGNYPANAFGLHDMHGNEWEWCNDWYGLYGGTVTDPVGAGSGSYRVFRGGSWPFDARYCRSANRGRDVPSPANGDLGFRVVRSSVQ
jgi:formylglycine-generating enzyme required for sulfatase activity